MLIRMVELSREDVTERLREQIRIHGSQKQAAYQLGITAQHFSDLINNYRQPGKKTLAALKLESVKVYRVRDE